MDAMTLFLVGLGISSVVATIISRRLSGDSKTLTDDELHQAMEELEKDKRKSGLLDRLYDILNDDLNDRSK